MHLEAIKMEQTKLEVLGKDLERLQTSLTNYEGKLINNPKSVLIAELVSYYKEQTRLVRMYILGLVKVIKDDKPEPHPEPTPVPVPVPEPTPEPTPVPEPEPVPDSVPEPATPEPVPVADTTPEPAQTTEQAPS